MTTPGDKIGHIRIDGYLAAGGMGAVFTGFDEKLERQVALKAFHSDRLTAGARDRFLLEARLLSQLDHPNICRIHGYLESEQGDFLVLELIRGRTLDEVLRAGIDGGARLAVAEGVARALEAAHEKGIVHRDLKPGNVMLTEDGGVKVLDFGLARSVGSAEEEAPEAPPLTLPPARAALWTPSMSSHTQHGALIGTPASMSPEQARGAPATAASDAYSLGLLLQEIFTGRPPYESGLSEDLLLVKAAEGDTLPVEGVRDADLAALIRRLKALAPEARPTAAEAAERLAWIRGRPGRRRRRLLAAVVAGLFVLGGVKYTLDLRRERQLALEARSAAEQAAHRADAVAQFLEDLFRASDPRRARGTPPDTRELLRRGTERLGKELQDQPLLRAQLLDTLGEIHTSLGLFDDARPLLREALAIRERLGGAGHLDVAETLGHLGALAQLSGNGDALPLLRRALAIYEAHPGPERPEMAELLNDLGAVLAAHGRFEEAEATLQRSLGLHERLWGPGDPRVAKVLHNLSGIAYYRDRIDESERLLKRSLAIREASLAENDPELAGSREALALLLQSQGKAADAVQVLERLAVTAEKIYGPEHPELARTLLNLGLARADLGQDAAALQLFERSLAIDERALEPGHPDIVLALTTLADHHRKHGRSTEAAPFHLRVLDATRRRLAAEPENPDLLAARARAFLALGRIEDARPLVESLQARGWKDAVLEELCRQHGVQVDSSHP